MKTVTESAHFRHSVRKYDSTPVPEKDIREILTIAGLAPSPWNVQPWRVIVVQDPEVKQKLMAAAYGQPQVGAAPAVFVIYSDMEDAIDHAVEFVHPGYGEKREEEAANMQKHFRGMSDEDRATWGNAESNIFLGFLLLAIAEKGYSSSAMLGFEPDKVRALFDLPAHTKFPALVAFGVGAEEGFPHHRHEVDRFTRWS